MHRPISSVARATRTFLETSPALATVTAYLGARVNRARAADRSRGASAVEWIVISAIVVAIVLVVGGILKSALEGKANDVSDRIKGS